MDITKLSAGKNPPEEVNVIIEIPQGSLIKYEVDEESGVIFADRFHYTSVAYPFNYGFIPQTHGEDGDPIDVMIISHLPIYPGIAIAVRPIGMLEMEDEEGIDTKIMAVATKKIDPYHANVEDIADIDEATKNKIKHFFDTYKSIEPNKFVKTRNFLPKEKAYEAIKKAMSK
jgi:inorganic pyrophosphatase